MTAAADMPIESSTMRETSALEPVGGGNGIAWKVAQVVCALLLTMCVGISSWTLKAVLRNSERLACIEANRFTSEHGLSVWKEIAAIREDMAKLPREVPPAWFVARVDKLEDKIDAMQVELRALTSKGRP